MFATDKYIKNVTRFTDKYKRNTRQLITMDKG